MYVENVNILIHLTGDDTAVHIIMYIYKTWLTLVNVCITLDYELFQL